MAKATNKSQLIERDPKWECIQAELSKPFPAKYIGVKPGATSETSALLLWFIDARAIMDRLDDVVGPENWSFSWMPIPVAEGRVAVQGKLRILDVVKEDVGEAQSEDEPHKSAVSDAFKRCGVHYGLARYLYSMPQIWWPYDKSRRRFDRRDDLADFIDRVVAKLISVDGDTTQLNVREIQAEASGVVDRIPQLNAEATPAQQERIRELQLHKFGAAQDARTRYDEFQHSVIGRASKRSKLTKYEADKVIKALIALPQFQEHAA